MLDSKKFKLTQEDKQRLLQLMREEETRFETSLRGEDTLSQQKADEEELSRKIQERFEHTPHMEEASEEPNNQLIEQNWAKLQKRIDAHQEDKSDASSGGSLHDIRQNVKKRSNFRLHFTSYLAAAAVLGLVLVNSPFWQEVSKPNQNAPLPGALQKGTVSKVSAFEGCTIDLLQGFDDQLDVYPFSALEQATLQIKPGEYRVSMRCGGRINPQEDPTIYAHFFVQSSQEEQAGILNVPILLNTTHVISNPDETVVFQMGSKEQEVSSSEQTLSIYITFTELEPGNIPIEELNQGFQTQQGSKQIIDRYELKLRADYDRTRDN